MIKILFLGDIVGRSGREAVHKYLPHIQKEHAIDATIINGENAAHGFGITKDICLDLFRLGVHVVTLGNHAWDNPDIVSWINQDKRIIRPTNFPKTHPGMGYTVVDLFSKGKVLVVNAQAQLFMHQHVDDPFAAVDNILRLHPLGVSVQGIVVDFHGEATSEKLAMGYFCDGRASLVVGTHTHVPTADARILPKGTAYLTDAGMCGDYNSVLGMDVQVPLDRFTKKITKDRLKPAQGPGSVAGVIVEIDGGSGLAKRMKTILLGPGFEACAKD